MLDALAKPRFFSRIQNVTPGAIGAHIAMTHIHTDGRTDRRTDKVTSGGLKRDFASTQKKNIKALMKK